MPILPQEIKWGEDNPIEAVPILTDEEKDIIRQKQEALDKLLADGGIGKYKIDLNFKSGYSTLKPSAGMISFWDSGKKFHGGGDTKIYLCPGKSLGKNTCEAPISETAQGYGFLLCPKCQTLWPAKDAIGEMMFRLTSNGWASVLMRYFVHLDMNADLRIKYPPDDIRSVTFKNVERFSGDSLDKARGRRQTRIYLVRSLIKDTTAGADLYQRILAFINA